MPKSIIDPNHLQRVRCLYKNILRLHRGLPFELKSIGDTYLKQEFRRHKYCNNTEAISFLTEWSKYEVLLSNQFKVCEKIKGFGIGIDSKDLDKFRNDQLGQLYELLKVLNTRH